MIVFCFCPNIFLIATFANLFTTKENTRILKIVFDYFTFQTMTFCWNIFIIDSFMVVSRKKKEEHVHPIPICFAPYIFLVGLRVVLYFRDLFGLKVHIFCVVPIKH